ncbi:hypothetical protein GF385_01210 [Candidatus Dependentiae bacterium]|nr:hypothetical protein [Candidatus Dependentiae bacterium]
MFRNIIFLIFSNIFFIYCFSDNTISFINKTEKRIYIKISKDEELLKAFKDKEFLEEYKGEEYLVSFELLKNDLLVYNKKGFPNGKGKNLLENDFKLKIEAWINGFKKVFWIFSIKDFPFKDNEIYIDLDKIYFKSYSQDKKNIEYSYKIKYEGILESVIY